MMKDKEGENMNSKKEKFSGKLKETAGKITGNEQLELKGKIQIAKAELSDKVNVKKNVNKVKESFAGKINNRLDKKSKGRSSKK